MEIGNRIRALRKGKGITQEQLAGRLGISFQAVSKWENNIALPDITMLPAIADFFEISMDELFDYSKERIRGDVEKICQEAYPLREKEPEQARRILEDGLIKYPGNNRLTNHLLYVMNCRENPDEVIETAGRLASECRDNEIRYDALRFLAYAYKAKGEQKNAEAALKQIPQLHFTKLSEAAFILEGRKKFEAASEQKWISLETAIQMFVKTAESLAEEGKNSEAETEADRALAIMDILKEEKMVIYENYLRKLKERLKYAAEG